MWLLIDDERDLNIEVIARTAGAGKMMLAAGVWECVCFDHDLGEQESGYDVLMWGLEREYIPSRVQLVTSNPVGRKNMRAALEAAGYATCDGTNFTRSEKPDSRIAQGDDGCLCQGCGKPYMVDLIIPDNLWEEIKPSGKAKGSGLLCGKCIMDKLEGRGEFLAITCQKE